MSGPAAKRSETFGVVIAGGLVAYGLVHLLLAWLTLQLAWTGSSGEQASVQGAFAELSESAVGTVLLWAVVVGMAALMVWQLSEAIWGGRRATGLQRWWHRARSAGRAVVYAVLGASAGVTAAGQHSQGSSKESLSASLMSDVWGRVLVIAVGLGIVAVGAALAWRGGAKRFTRQMAGEPGRVALRLGQIGYPAKGLVLLLIGALFDWAAITYDPEKAQGMDAALRTVRDQPFGPALLTIVAAGLAAFGLYCFAWSRRPRH